MECLEVDDIRDDRRCNAIFGEHRCEEAGRDNCAVRARECGTYPSKLAGKERVGIAASIIDDNGLAALAADPDRRCGVQVPRPPRVGHDVDQVGLARGNP